MSDKKEEQELVFHHRLHVNYFLMALNSLPSHYVGLDSSKMSAIYFISTALDLLHVLEDPVRQRLIDSIYFYQLHPSGDRPEEEIDQGVFGFLSGPTLKNDHYPALTHGDNRRYSQGHIAMIYTALASLLICGDDLKRVNRSAISQGLQLLQDSKTGCFTTYLYEGEYDLRFVYCACAIAKILNLWHSMNIPLLLQYIRDCWSYEGGFGLHPHSEAHGGATYCALASLALLEEVDTVLTLSEQQAVITWCEQRQLDGGGDGPGGFQGRVNKAADSCYSYWIGASLAILGVFPQSDQQSTRTFLLGHCQRGKMGGFAKSPDQRYPDLIHSFYSLAWLALSQQQGQGQGKEEEVVKALDPLLAIPLEAAERVSQNKRKK